MAEKNYGNNSQLAELMKYISDTMKFPIMGAGGGFAPIGTEAYFDGQVAPLGWVICDGTELNIADYPDLATYYASQHGSTNYYGGDGVTTFAVPTRSGMPTNVDEVFTTTEHIVGTYTDGRPIYKKVYPFTYTGGETLILLSDIIGVEKSQTTYFQAEWHSLITNDNSSSNEYYFSNSDFYNWYYEPSSKKVHFRSGSELPKKPVDMLFICNYTKSADTPVSSGHSSDGNGVFCVKATLSDTELNNMHVYSPNEHKVGWWQEEVDGVLKEKPVYEKTIVLKRNGTDKYTYSSNIYNNCLPSNIDVICSSKLNAKRGAGAYEGYVDIYNNDADLVFVPNPTTMSIYFHSTYTTTDLIYTLEYTKTTDQWQTV